MVEIKKGQIVTLRAELLEPGAQNLPHVALEDSSYGFVRVEIAGEYKYPFKPINDWNTDWIAVDGTVRT